MKIRTGTVQEAVELALKIPEFPNPYNLRSAGTAPPALDHVLIAESDGVSVGFRAGRRFSNDTFAVWLAGVLPEYRRQGIAGQLYRAQKDWLESQGYRFIRTHVRNSNRLMLRILLDAGYHIEDVIRYGDAWRNKIVFVKNLRPSEASVTDGPLIVGLLRELDGDRADQDIRDTLRNLTLSWLRFKYSGRIIEDTSVDAILAQAAQSEHRYCLILTAGNIVSHAWKLGLVETLQEWADARRFFAAGEILGDPRSGWGLSTRCVLVNLREYRRLGRPKHATSLAAEVPILSLPESITSTLLYITPEGERRRDAFRRILGEGIATASLTAEEFSEDQRRFLTGVQRQVQNCRKGVFVWNFESYDDVNDPPPGFASPVSTLYSVAAGLKPNWILQTHGFDDNTALVYVDYSEQALRFQRLVHEEWDGEDYPAFLRYLFTRLQPGETFYQLWGGFSPEDMDWKTVQDAWTRETARWGGEEVLKEHWRRARSLRVRYVRANLLEDHDTWLEPTQAGRSPVIWWSNVFFTFYSNWFHSIPQRREIYARFIRRLTGRCPHILMYGNDYNNIPLAGVRADEYSRAYFIEEDDPLEPRRIARSAVTC